MGFLFSHEIERSIIKNQTNATQKGKDTPQGVQTISSVNTLAIILVGSR